MCRRMSGFCIFLAFVATFLTTTAKGQSSLISQYLKVPEHVWEVEKFLPEHSAGLFVGIRDFDHQEFPEIGVAIDDAIDIAHLFGRDLGVIPPPKVRLILTGEPTKGEAKRKLADLISAGSVVHEEAAEYALFGALREQLEKVEKQGFFVLFLSSHGLSFRNGTYAVASNSAPESPESLVDLRTVFETVEESPAERNLVLLDIFREPLGRPASRQFANMVSQLKRQAVLSSAPLEGFSYDDYSRGGSVFSSAILDGLLLVRAASDGRNTITVGTLRDYVDQRLSGWSKKNKAYMTGTGRSMIQVTGGLAEGMALASISLEFRERQRRDDALNVLRHKYSEQKGVTKSEVIDAVYQIFSSPDAPATFVEEIIFELSALAEGASLTSFEGFFYRNKKRFSQLGESLKQIHADSRLSMGSGNNNCTDPGKWSFNPVAAGEFDMGSSKDEGKYYRRYPDETKHKVTLNRDFQVGTTEVTQAQWMSLVSKNPSRIPCEDCPVDRVNWYEAVYFSNELSRLQGLGTCYEIVGCAGNLGEGCSGDVVSCVGSFSCSVVRFKGLSCEGYRLPTEAEWEFATRGGLKMKKKKTFWMGDRMWIQHGNFDAASLPRPRQGSAEATFLGRSISSCSYSESPLGLYNVHGNVSEWVWDWFASYPEGSAVDPTGPPDGAHRVFRGGSWFNIADFCRSAVRNWASPQDRLHYVGFRLVRTASTETSEN